MSRFPRCSLDLFVVGYALLFLKLACIRWFPASPGRPSFSSGFLLRASTLSLLAGFCPLLDDLDGGVRIEPDTSAQTAHPDAGRFKEAGVNLPFRGVLAPTFWRCGGAVRGSGGGDGEAHRLSDPPYRLPPQPRGPRGSHPRGAGAPPGVPPAGSGAALVRAGELQLAPLGPSSR